MLSCLCGVEPRVVENDPPLCSAEEFRAMHQRKDMKGQQVSIAASLTRDLDVATSAEGVDTGTGRYTGCCQGAYRKGVQAMPWAKCNFYTALA